LSCASLSRTLFGFARNLRDARDARDPSERQQPDDAYRPERPPALDNELLASKLTELMPPVSGWRNVAFARLQSAAMSNDDLLLKAAFANLNPAARDNLRGVLIRDHADRDARCKLHEWPQTFVTRTPGSTTPSFPENG
jgi:hypothetical protein